MSTQRQLARAAAATLATLLGACGSGELVAVVTPTPVPRPGTATVSITTAPAGVSALRLRVTGAGVSAPVAGDEARILLQGSVADTSVLVLAVSGTLPSTLLTLTLADAERPISVVVQDATTGRNAGYRSIKAADVQITVTKQ